MTRRNRPNLLIAATITDATEIKREFREFSSWHVMTPRSHGERGWLYGDYIWTPAAQQLPAHTRWGMRIRIKDVIDERSEEKPFPARVKSW